MFVIEQDNRFPCYGGELHGRTISIVGDRFQMASGGFYDLRKFVFRDCIMRVLIHNGEFPSSGAVSEFCDEIGIFNLRATALGGR